MENFTGPGNLMLQVQLMSKDLKYEEMKIMEVIQLRFSCSPAQPFRSHFERYRIDSLCYLSGRLQTDPIVFMFFPFNEFGQLTRDENVKIYMPQFRLSIIFCLQLVFGNPVSHIGSNL